MEVNNFKAIEDYISLVMLRDGSYPGIINDAFFEVRILTRNKDFNDDGHNGDFSHTYHIYTLTDLSKFKNQIITLCNTFNARAYISICRKSVKGITRALNLEIARSFINDDPIKPWKVLDRVIMQYHKSKERKFMIDVDNKDKEYIDYIKNVVKYINGEILAEIQTIHGVHLITSPFNLDEYKSILNKDHKEISEIKKNHITLLYANINENEI